MKDFFIIVFSFICFLFVLAFLLLCQFVNIVQGRFITMVLYSGDVGENIQSAEIALFKARTLYKKRRRKGKIVYREEITHNLFICIEISFLEEVILIYSTKDGAHSGMRVAKALEEGSFRKVAFVVHEKDIFSALHKNGINLPIIDSKRRA